ncbi:MAG: hypothetical protein EA369_03445 [Bradymonadales bacterium]|nr:MAG: hypothetical protein EA369_03445 [Bradymonadales bacterium]
MSALPFSSFSEENFRLDSSPEALRPLQPEEELSGLLRLEPSETATAIRRLRESDTIRILRSQGEWYELELESEEGVVFRGWVKASLAPERLAAEAPKMAELDSRPEALDYFLDRRLRWFWSPRMKRALTLEFGLGLQNQRTQWDGNDPSLLNPASNQLNGLDLQASAKLQILEYEFGPGTWGLGSQFRYHLGFYQVNFPPGEVIPPELRGQAYQQLTHQLQADLFKSFVNSISRLRLRLEAGVGIFFHESSPDAKSVVEGQPVFTRLEFFSPMIRLGAGLEFSDRWSTMTETGLMLFSQWSETPSASANKLETTGFPIWLRIKTEYRWLDWLGNYLSAEALLLKARQDGPSSRGGITYDRVDLDLRPLRVTAGFSLIF